MAAERLRLIGFDNRLIIDCFANVINILIWLFSTNDRFRNERSQFIVENTDVTHNELCKCLNKNGPTKNFAKRGTDKLFLYDERKNNNFVT